MGHESLDKVKETAHSSLLQVQQGFESETFQSWLTTPIGIVVVVAILLIAIGLLYRAVRSGAKVVIIGLLLSGIVFFFFPSLVTRALELLGP